MSRLKDSSFRLEGEFNVAIVFVDGVGFYYESDGEEYKINLNEVLCVEVEKDEKTSSSYFGFISKETGGIVELDEYALCEISVREEKLKDVKKFIGICEKNGLRLCIDKECSETYLQGESGGNNEFMELCDGKLLYYAYGCLLEFTPCDVAEIVVDENCTVSLNDKNGNFMTSKNKLADGIGLFMTFKKNDYSYALNFAKSLAKAGFNVKGFTVQKVKSKDALKFGSKNSNCTFIFTEEKKLFFDNSIELYPIDLNDVLCANVERSGVINLISKKTGKTLEIREGYKCELYIKKSEINKKDKFFDICEKNSIPICMDKECTRTYLQGVKGGNEFMEIYNGKLIYYKFGNFFKFSPKDVSKVYIKGHKIYLVDEDGEIIELEKADGSDDIACMSFKRKSSSMSKVFLESLKKIGFNT